MKSLTALLGATTLLTADTGHADDNVSADQAAQLQQAGTIKVFVCQRRAII